MILLKLVAHHFSDYCGHVGIMLEDQDQKSFRPNRSPRSELRCTCASSISPKTIIQLTGYSMYCTRPLWRDTEDDLGHPSFLRPFVGMRAARRHGSLGWFHREHGLRQGLVLAPFVFNTVVLYKLKACQDTLVGIKK